jgi:transposase-like protein
MSESTESKSNRVKALLTELVGELSGKEQLECLTRDLMKTVVETALNGELDEHLGYERNAKSNQGNSRNGYYPKTLKSSSGAIAISVPRDRNGEFEPQIISKGQTRLTQFDNQILSCYARGMSTRDIAATFEEMFGAKVSHDVISKVTESVQEQVELWQNRPLDAVYPIVYLDCLQVKVHQDKRVINKAIYLALAVNVTGHKELLGMWVSENEGAKFWLSVLTELNNRGVKDILIACVDGLTGFPDAIATVFPKTATQLCIVHMIRNSLRYVSWKDRKQLAIALKQIYTSATAEEARAELEGLKKIWGEKYPSVYQSWDRNWENIIPFFDFPGSIRKVIYTTNAIESLNSVIRKAIKNRKIFPSDKSALKTIFLATDNAAKKWTMPIRDWGVAMQFFNINFDGRVNL